MVFDFFSTNCSSIFIISTFDYHKTFGQINKNKKDQLISAGLPKRLAASYSHRGNPPTTIGAEEL
ncbi:hypothetical protein VSK90_21095, partial [Bacillus swezeyi]|uniref:hypothetical protein n=1 Tax=Bacillus swezeyi TaxID=1925020 RepID=UPI0039C75D85